MSGRDEEFGGASGALGRIKGRGLGAATPMPVGG
jgi:hypothetical protein